MTAPDATRRAGKEQEILDAAARLFRAQGYASTSMRDIGADLGVNHASSHYYFGTKAAMLYAICERATDGVADRLAGRPTGSPIEQLAELARIAVKEAARQPDYTAVFFQERLWLERHLPADRSARIRTRQSLFRDRVCQVIEDGTAAGVFAVIDPVLVVEMIVGAATWMYQQQPDTPPTDAAVELCVTAVLHGTIR